jgi:hypothetical protein
VAHQVLLEFGLETRPMLVALCMLCLELRDDFNNPQKFLKEFTR